MKSIMNVRLLLAALFFAGTVFFSCSPKNYPLDKQITDHLLFKQGSYWIFADSVGLNVDSVYVWKYSDEQSSTSVDMTFTAGRVRKIAIVLCKNADTAEWFMSCFYKTNDVVLNLSKGSHQYSDYYLDYVYPTSYTYDSLTINGNKYRNVKLLTDTAGCSMYFAEDTGPIAIDMIYNSTPYQRQLLRSHIVF